MDRQLVCGSFGTIYDAVFSEKTGMMTGNRTNRTDECIRAVAKHMKFRADENKETPGYWQYQWAGIGTLTWESQKWMKN